MSVQLIIKSAAQNLDDFKLTCEMAWTIAQVKDEITTTHPTKPARDHQKLIYGGKLLPDHLPLTSILSPTQDVHILHLVCPCPVQTETHKSSSVNEKNQTPNCSVPPLNPSGFYPQVNPQLPTPPVFNSTSQSTTTSFLSLNTPGDAFHQYLAMQQMYTQIMTQYLSQYNGVAPNGQLPAPSPSVQEPAPAAPPIQNANQNAAARVGGGEGGWDWIDLMYILSRATVFFMVLLYYSSPPRVIAVGALMVILALFARANRERQREEAQQQQANERQRNEINTAPEDNPNADDAAQAAEETPEEVQSAAPPAPTPIQTALSVPMTILYVIYSFFTSLIPADPVPVNVN